MQQRKVVLGMGIVLLAMVPLLELSAAPSNFPTRPLQLVVPMGAGGSHDLHARAICSVIDKYLGMPMTVTLRPGGSGVIGTQEVADSRKDGYTLLLGGTGPNTALPLMQEIRYNQESFVPIAMINYAPVVFAVRADSPFYTAKDLIDYISKNPGKLNYASGGPYGNLHIPLVLLFEAGGVFGEIMHVPFDGGGPALIALLGGDVDVTAAFPAALQDHIKAGKLRAIGVSDTKRLGGVYENVPTLIEQGFNVKFQMWRTVMAPAGIPEDVQLKLREAFKKLSQDVKFKTLIEQMGERSDLYMDGPEFVSFWNDEQVELEKVVPLMMKE
jgi:tripartite-type tricarboxylate transporter receptor subunit TctC